MAAKVGNNYELRVRRHAFLKKKEHGIMNNLVPLHEKTRRYEDICSRYELHPAQ
jgi:hypothetical protein